MGWPPEGTPVLSLHYRAGDACLEEQVTLGRKCEPFSASMAAANQLASKYGIRYIYLATDSAKLTSSGELSSYSNYTFLFAPTVSRGGVRDHVELDKALHEGLIDGCQEGTESLLDIHMLAQGDALVSKFSSNMARVAYSLMYARKLGYAPFISMDNKWCFDFGVASRVDASDTANGGQGADHKLFYC